nr:DUF2812 domain-containing protein [uncultured Aminipila sp.]
MKHIIKSFNFGVLDHNDAEKLLNDMALKGYEFKGTGKGWIKGFAMFEKKQYAKSLQYAVDVHCKLLGKEKEAYYEFLNDLGWNNVDCFRNKLHIFAAEKNCAFPLYTDEYSELENLKKGIKDDGLFLKSSLSAAFLLGLVWVMFRLGGIGINRVVSYIIVVVFLLTSILAICNLILTLWCKKSIKTGEKPTNNSMKKEIRWWENILTISSFIFFPSVAIAGYSYEIWGSGINPGKGFGPTWEITFLSMGIISILVLLSATYMLFLYPEKEKYKVLSFSGYLLYFISIYEYFTTYMTR